MSVGVVHTLGGTVVVAEPSVGLRHELWPDQAERAAADLEERARAGTTVFVVFDALHDCAFRCVASATDAVILARSLRIAAGSARAALEAGNEVA